MERDKLDTKVVIWGAGQALLKWSSILPKVDYIVDRNVEIQGRVYCGCKICGPEQLKKEEGRIQILISSRKYEEEIRKDIEMLHLNVEIDIDILDTSVETYGELKSYAQYGEDIIIAKLFRVIGQTKISYIDIGLPTPVDGSNTYYFHCMGNCGVCVEPNPDVIEEIKKVRVNDIVVNSGIGSHEDEGSRLQYTRFVKNPALNTFSEEAVAQKIREGFTVADRLSIQMISLNSLIKKYFADEVPELISIDAEQYEIEIVKDFNFEKYPVKIFCIEKYSNITEIMESKGYALAAQTPCNYIFMRADLYNDYFINWAEHVMTK